MGNLATSSFLIWLRFLFHPIAGVRQILRESATNITSLPELKVWLPAVAVAFLLDYPIIRLYGIAWNNVGFYAANRLIVLFALFAQAITLYGFIRLSSFSISFSQMRALFTLMVAYLPFTSITQWAWLLRTFDLIQQVKHNAGYNLEGLKTVLATLVSQQAANPPNSLEVLASEGGNLAGFVLLALFAELLVQWFDAQRFRAYLVVGIGGFISTVVAGLLAFVPRVIEIYSFVE